MPPMPHNPQWDQITWAHLAPKVQSLREQAERDLAQRLCKDYQEYLERYLWVKVIKKLEEQADIMTRDLAANKEKSK